MCRRPDGRYSVDVLAGRGEEFVKSQKEHWLGWLSEYDGPGFYNRQSGKRSAEFVYNHINRAPMVLWLGEASGISKTKVSQAKRAALSARRGYSSQCAAIRKIIPWDMIEGMLTGGKGRVMKPASFSRDARR